MGRPRRNDHNREKLLEQGLASFATKGFHGTGIKEILDDVNVPKGSFYNYFKSKETFGAEIIMYYAQGMYDTWDQYFAEHQGNPLEGMRYLFGIKIQHYAGEADFQGCLIGNLTAEIADTSTICRQAMEAAMDGLKTRFQTQIEKAVAMGLVRTDLSPQQMSTFFWDAWEGALLRMKMSRSVAPLQQTLDFVLNDFVLKR